LNSPVSVPNSDQAFPEKKQWKKTLHLYLGIIKIADDILQPASIAGAGPCGGCKGLHPFRYPVENLSGIGWMDTLLLNKNRK